MKKLFTIAFVFSACLLFAQSKTGIENIIFITTDGFRWQEVFKGMDTALANNPKFNQKDSAGIYKKYWANTPEERRSKLLPFLWNKMIPQGQGYGNRLYSNKVDNSNPYWFSYPGYSETLCGYVDTAINTNSYPNNPNTNVFEFINKQAGFKGKVAAFCAWDAFDKILNEERSGVMVISGSDSIGGKNPDAEQKLINKMKDDSYTFYGPSERLDVFTHYNMMDHLKKQKPRAMYISYGETDHWAHEARYMDYLDAAHQVDAWLAEIWNFVQNDPQYKNKTAMMISVDHGRGDIVKEKWTSHNAKIEDSHEIWFALIGPGIPAKGEMKTSVQFYQKQYAQTLAQLLGLNFTCEHPVGEGLKDVLMK